MLQYLQKYKKSLVVKNGWEQLSPPASASPSIVSPQLHYSLIRSLHTHFLWHCRTPTCAAVGPIERTDTSRSVQLSRQRVGARPLHSRDNLLISFSYGVHPPPHTHTQLKGTNLASSARLSWVPVGRHFLQRDAKAAISAGRENKIILIGIYTYEWNLQRLTGRVLSVDNTEREWQGREVCVCGRQIGRWIWNKLPNNN